jgi:hypothetical protein
VKLAGPASRYCGELLVTGEERQADGRRAWLGRVDRDGRYHAGRAASGCTGAIAGALRAFAEDPAGVASAYGREFGRCCFCSRELTDPRSVTVGYGPDCADRYALPWGA